MPPVLALVLASAVIGGCGNTPDPKHIDPAFWDATVEFFDAAEMRNRCWSDVYAIKMEFVDDFGKGSRVAGTTNDNLIRISKATWVEFDENRRRILLWHELGHWIGMHHPCSIDDPRGAVCTKEDERKLMYPYVLESEVFAPHREALLDCVFGVGACPGW